MLIAAPRVRVPPAMALAFALLASACGQLHEEIPPGVSYEPGSIDVRAPGDPTPTGAVETPAGTLRQAETATSAASHPSINLPDRASDEAAEATVAALEASLYELLDSRTADSGADQAAAMAVRDLFGSGAPDPATERPEGTFAGGDRVPKLLTADALNVTGDSVPSIVATWDQAGLPVLVAVHDAGQWRVHRLPVGWPDDGRGEGVRVLGDAADLSGDGVKDIVYAAPIPDTQVTVIRVAMYDIDGFFDILTATSETDSDGDTSPSWSVEPSTDDHGARLVASCALVGPFDTTNGARPDETRTYAWTPDAGLHLVERKTAVHTPQEAANTAEAALRHGDLDSAEALFRLAEAGDPEVDGNDDGVDWHALAMLRLGWLYAMEGRTAQARIAVAAAVGGGGGIGEIADSFLAAYDTADGPRALAASMRARSAITGGLNPDEVLWPGHVLAAWVTKHGVDTLGDEPATTLRVDLSLPIRGAKLADFDDDGADELAVVLDRPDGSMADLWIVDPGEPAAAAVLVTSGDLQLGDPTTLPGGGPGLNLTGAQASFIVGWDSNVPALFAAAAPHDLVAYPPGRDPRVGHEPCVVHP